MKKILTITLLSLILLLNNCALVPIGLVTSSISLTNDRRSTGTIVDDKTLNNALVNWADGNPATHGAHVNFNTFDKAVLITGEVPSEAAKTKISEEVVKFRSDIAVVNNELVVTPNSPFSSRLTDTKIKLVIDSLFYEQEVFNPSHVLVTVENKVVFLIGSVTQREAKKAIKQASTAIGVRKIITLFNYLEKRPQAEIERDNRIKQEREIQAAKQKKRDELSAKKSVLQKEINQLDSGETTRGTSF